MPTVGRTLAAERVRQGLELATISSYTKIPLRLLKAIEAEEFDHLPGPTFARNFVRQYAEALQLDDAAMVEQFHREQSIAEPRFAIPVPPSPRVPMPRMERPGFRALFEGSAFSAFLLFLLTIGLCAGAFYAYSYLLRIRAAVAPSKASAHAAAFRVPEAKPIPPASIPVAAAAVETPAAGIHVTLTASEACWTRITADGANLFAGILEPGETREMTAAETVVIRAGNAGALAVKWNGKDLPAVGPKGQVRILTITPRGAAVRAPDMPNQPIG